MNTEQHGFQMTAAGHPCASVFIHGLALVVLLSALAGCVSKKSAQENAARAYQAGQQNAIQQQVTTPQGPVVNVSGNVQNRVVPWHDTLTLSQAIVAAEYSGRLNPTAVIVHRGGQAYSISVQMLMRGLQDMPLEPDDVIEIR